MGYPRVIAPTVGHPMRKIKRPALVQMVDRAMRHPGRVHRDQQKTLTVLGWTDSVSRVELTSRGHRDSRFTGKDP